MEDAPRTNRRPSVDQPAVIDRYPGLNTIRATTIAKLTSSRGLRRAGLPVDVVETTERVELTQTAEQ